MRACDTCHYPLLRQSCFVTLRANSQSGRQARDQAAVREMTSTGMITINGNDHNPAHCDHKSR